MLPGLCAAGFVRYALRSPHIPRKIGLGLLLVYWREHIFQLSNYAGLFFGLKANINALLRIDSGAASKTLLVHFLSQLRATRQPFSKTDYYDFAFGQSRADPGGPGAVRSEVVNDYFQVHREKYLGALERGPDPLDLNRRELRLAHADCFLTRYVYYGFARWAARVRRRVGA